MKLSDWLPSVFVEGDGDDIQVTTKKFSQFPTASGEGVQGVGIKDGNNVKFDLTTDSISVNPNQFRNAKGQFIGTPEELEELKNQRDVNEFFYNAINDIEQGDIDLEGYATEAQLTEVDRTSQIRDEALDEKIERESTLNTAAHLKLEQQIVALDDWSTHRDEKLQAQIDDLPTTEYVDNGDRTLQTEIDQIALALEALLVQREHGQWKYVGFSGDTIPRNAGEFALAVDDIESSNENIITLNTTDLDGKAHGFADVEVGDYIEVVDRDAPEAYALFVVAKAPEGTGIVNVEVTLKEAGLNIWVGETCEIRFFQVNEQDLQLDDLDKRYLRLAGGSMDGSATLKVNVLEPVNTPMIQYNGDPESTHAAGLINRYMMTEHTKKYLPLSGGQMTGGINMGTTPIMSVQYLGMTGAKCIQEAQTTRIKFDGKVTIAKAGTNKAGFVLKGATADGADSDLLSVYHNDNGVIDAVNYKGKQDSDTNVATCGFVQEEIGKIEIPEAGGKQMFTTSVYGNSSNSLNLSLGDWHFLQSDLQTPTVVGSGARGIVYKISNKDWWKGKVELTGFGYVVVTSAKSGETYFAGNVIASDLNALNEKGEVVLNLPSEGRQWGMNTATLGETQRIEFINVFREL
jgi:hypothetical protein